MDFTTLTYILVTLGFATLLYRLLWAGGLNITTEGVRPITAPKLDVNTEEETDGMHDDYKPDDVTVSTTEQDLFLPKHSLLREDPDVLAALAAAGATEAAAVKTEQIIKKEQGSQEQGSQEQGSQEPDAEQLGWSFVLPEK